MSSSLVDKPDIVQVMEREGAVFRKQGKSYVTCCPLHSEKTPSCYVDTDKQVFYCQGCHEGGDVITFIEKLRGCDFKDALRYLGIQNDKPYKPNPEAGRKKKLRQEFEEWERNYFDEIVTFYRAWNKLKPTLKTPEQVEQFADLYKQESVWEYELDILSYVGSDPEKNKAKFELYQEKIRQEQKYRELGTRIDSIYEKFAKAKIAAIMKVEKENRANECRG